MIADRYVLVTEIGRGGMGIVWRGEDRLIGRPVAIKELVVKSGAADADGAPGERMLREVRASGRLNHRAAVTVYDVVWQDGRLHIVMELVEAPSLRTLVERSGTLPPRQVAAVGMDVLDALGQAHKANIVHRDVKPGNIMVLPEGGAKLADFGIAQMRGDSRITRTGMIIGSPSFVAPEQINGDRATPATDLWQLGVTLYYALEGRSPFEREDHQATLFAVLGADPEPPRCGEPLASSIVGLLTKDPQGRPDPAELRTVLARCAQAPARKATTRQVTVAAEKADPAPQRRRHAASASPGPPARPGGRRRRWLRRTVLGLAAAVLAAGAFGVGVLVDHRMIVPQVSRQGPDTSVVIPWSTPDTAQVGTIDLSRIRFPDRGCANGEIQPGQALAETDCRAAHQVEIWDSFRIPRDGSSPYPDQGFIARTARMTCEGSLASYVRGNPALGRGGFAIATLVPDQAQWDGDSSFSNVVYCALRRVDGRPIDGHDLLPPR